MAVITEKAAPEQIGQAEEPVKTDRSILLFGLAILVLNALFFLWTLIKPGSHALSSAVDNVGQFALILLVLPLAFLATHGRSQRPLPLSARLSPVFLGLGAAAFVIGQMIWTYYQEVIHQPPFPSWADAGYLAGYPLLLLGILWLPSRSLSGAARTKVLFDALMVMTTLTTFSWFFVLGPTIMQGGESALGKLVGTAYPLFDLVLIASLGVLWARAHAGRMKIALGILSLGLFVTVITDSLFDYQSLHGTYSVPDLIDVGWPLSYMLICLAAYVSGRAMLTESPETAGAEDMLARVESPQATGFWRSLLPYALVPAVIGLIIYALASHPSRPLLAGVEVGAAFLVLVVLLRQILTAMENERLRRQEQDYIREAGRVMTAAGELEAGRFDPAALEPVMERDDTLGLMARVFHRMAREVKAREERLRQQVTQLRVEIDEAKRSREVAEITETGYFKDLQAKARKMRQSAGSSDE